MPDFDYLVIDTAGREVRGHIAADTIDDARDRLDRKRFHVVKIEAGTGGPARGKPLLSDFRLGRRKMSVKQLTLFTRQLATLNQVSPLEESLRTITRQTEQESVRTIVASVHAGVMEGRRLAEAMGREPKSFPPLYRAMVAAGERSGSLPTILDRLSILLERQAEISGKIVTTLAYPTVLAVVAMGVVTALMAFVVPQVVEQFDNVGQQLPLLTRLVIGLSDLLVGYWWAMLLAVALISLICWQALKQPSIRLAFDGWLLRIPLLGRLLRDLHAARMARTLATMVASRLPLLEGLTLTAGTIHNRRLRAASDEIVEIDPRRRQSVRGNAPRRRLSAAADLSCRIGRIGGQARRDARTRCRLSRTRVRPLHRDRFVAARARDHRRHGRYRCDDRAIHSAADPAAQHPGWTMRAGQ